MESTDQLHWTEPVPSAQQVEQLHWSQMNCPLNPHATDGESLYCSAAPPPSYTLPDDCTCTIYHPCTLDARPGIALSQAMQERIMAFINTHDVTDSGNVTQLVPRNFERLLTAPTVIGVVQRDTTIIGTMFSLPLRVRYQDTTLLSSYTTFLCVSKEERASGLAMVLIRAVMQLGYQWYGINHGYYMTATPHHPIATPLKSWYRPINLKHCKASGFTLQPFATVDHERRAYHVGRPRIMPLNATSRDYQAILPLLQSGDFHLAPTQSEWSQLCECFDCYVVPGKGVFFLFPLRVHMSERHKTVNIAQLALMVGDVLPQALWIADQQHYDLLYGRYYGAITESRVAQIRGQTTAAQEVVEFYNTRMAIAGAQMAVPIF